MTVWKGISKFKNLQVLTGGTFTTLSNLTPATSDSAALGTTALMWSDLFLASAGVINFNAGDVTITHGSNLLTIGGGTLTLSDTTDASSLTAGALVVAGGIACAKQLFLGDDIDMSVNGTGVYDITLKDSVADALSIVRGTTDMVVFNSSTPSITITPVTTITGLLTTTGGITNNSAGIAAAGAISGATTIAASTSVTVTSASASALAVGRLGATTPAFVVDASAGTSITGIKITSAASAGGVAVVAVGESSVALTINAAGTGTIGIGSVSTGAVTITPATTVTGVLTANNATESISTATGGLVVAGGIGFGGDMYVGDDIFLTTGAVLNWAAGGVTITHAANKLAFAGATAAGINGYAFDMAVGTIASEAHGVDITATGTLASNKSLVGLNVKATAAGSAGAWLAGLFVNATQASKMVNGYLCAAEFELTSTAADASDNSVVVLNSVRNHTGSPPACDPYITLREYGTTYGDVFLRIFGDTGQGAITGGASSTLLVTNTADKAATTFVRCMFGSTVFWLMGTTNAPS